LKRTGVRTLFVIPSEAENLWFSAAHLEVVRQRCFAPLNMTTWLMAWICAEILLAFAAIWF